MEHFFYAEIKACIRIPDEYFEFICKCAAHHYDGKVKSLVEVGGFLYGEKNTRQWLKESQSHDESLDDREYTFRQIDLMCKAIEFPSTPLGEKITKEFVVILGGISDKSEYINHILKSK